MSRSCFARDSNDHAADQKHGTHPHLVLWIQAFGEDSLRNSCGQAFDEVADFSPQQANKLNKPKHHEVV